MIKSMLAGLACATTLISAVPTAAQDMSADEAAVLKALDDALPGELIHNPLDTDWNKNGNDVRTKLVDAATLPSGQAVSVRNKKVQKKAWDSTLGTQISGPVMAGDEIEIYFWARTAKTPKGRDAADVSIFVGRNVEPYDNILAQPITLTPEWKLQSLKGTAIKDYPADSLKVEYQIGRAIQTLELGPVYVSKL